jgi:NADPH2:quinone reductase
MAGLDRRAAFVRAAVLHQFGAVPRYEEFPDPELGPEDAVIAVRAAALENIDRAIAEGTHYSSRHMMPSLPAVVGLKGIGVRDDGALVGFGGVRPPYGAMAERVAAPRAYGVPIPDGVDPAVAAAVPGSALTALLPLRCGAKLAPGEMVLVNGATGFSGRLAIQVARLLGAGRVVGTGRHRASLVALSRLGADAVVDLTLPDDAVVAAFRREAGDSGYGVILDFLWGYPTELLLEALVPDDLSFAQSATRLVQIGVGAGPTIALAGDTLRTSGLRIIGAGDAVTPEAVGDAARQVWEWIAGNRLEAAIERVALHDIERAWLTSDLHGTRIVIVP